MLTQFPHLPPLEGAAPLPHLGVIRVLGDDAANFLHNQLTQDVLLMRLDQSHLGAFCNAKGRMQASFVFFKPHPSEVLLVCRRDLIAQTIKRLSMFVLRAKVKLTDASADFQMFGLAGDCLKSLLQNSDPDGLQNTTPLTTPWRRIHLEQDNADLLTLYPAMGQARALWLSPLPSECTPPAEDALKKPAVVLEPRAQPSTFPALDADLWQLGDVLSGVAWVEQATFEAFVPQMLNYESVDGVNFKKGCYPGQEVVARSQFRGTLKRRAYVVQSETAISAGQEIFSSDAADQPCGLVAQTASFQGHTFAIAELQTAAAQEKRLHVGACSGPSLQVLPLPYPLREDI